MATKFERIYVDMENEFKEIQENFDYDCISKAFGHSILKMVFGLSDDEAYDCNTDGSDDNGIDAIYFENNKTIHFFQFKFPGSAKNISKGVTDEEILKLCSGIQMFTAPDETFNSISWNAILKDKRQEFLNADIYNFKIWIVRFSNQEISDSANGKIKEFINKYYRETGNKIEYEFLLASECLKLYENTAKNIWPDFKLPYNKTLTPFADEKANISSAYVTLKDIYETFFPIQDIVFEGNVRYLSCNSRINDGIKNTILTNSENFHLLNNGITIVCNECKDINAKSFFDIRCGTIINGAQTVGTIINTLNELGSDEIINYNKSFVFVRIVSFSKENKLINEMVYTLNTQNQMKNSYTIANDIIVKNIQARINTETDYFLEIKNNEYNYLKIHNKNFNKLSKNRIDIETFIQVYTTFYNVEGMASLSKNNKASLFVNENVQKIINELNFESSLLSYKVYTELMNIIKGYRAYRKNPEKKEILEILDIDEKEIDDYRYLNTGNFVILFALGLVYVKKEVDPIKNMILVIKSLKNIFKKEKNLSNATKIKETFEKVENYVKKFKVENELIIAPKKIDISKL